jgi:hypothetical protein
MYIKDFITLDEFITKLQKYQKEYGNYHITKISYCGGTEEQGGGNVFSLINDERREEEIIIANILDKTI